MGPTRFVKDSWTARACERFLHLLGFTSELRIQLGHLVILRSERCGFFEVLFSRFPKFSNLPLESFSLRGKRLELFSILLLDRVQAVCERLADRVGSVFAYTVRAFVSVAIALDTWQLTL